MNVEILFLHERAHTTVLCGMKQGVAGKLEREGFAVEIMWFLQRGDLNAFYQARCFKGGKLMATRTHETKQDVEKTYVGFFGEKAIARLKFPPVRVGGKKDWLGNKAWEEFDK